MRILLGFVQLALLLLAAACLLVAMAVVVAGAERVRDDQAYLACFQRAARQVQADRAAARALREGISQPSPCLPISVNSWDGAPEEPPFDGKTTPPPGGFTLSFWRGEWREYYASWSGQKTLLASDTAYYRAFWHWPAGALLIAFAALWGVWRIARPLSKPRATA